MKTTRLILKKLKRNKIKQFKKMVQLTANCKLTFVIENYTPTAENRDFSGEFDLITDKQTEEM